VVAKEAAESSDEYETKFQLNEQIDGNLEF
jgi:hypothetical protein